MNTQAGKGQTIFPRWKSGVLLAGVLLMGCQELGLPSLMFHNDRMETRHTLETVFTPTPQDTAFLATLGKEAEKRLMSCQQTQDCEAAHFIRALALMRENRDLALHHFQKVAVSPIDSPLARSSRVWIWILDETSPANASAASGSHLVQGMTQALLTNDLALARQPLSHRSSDQETRTPHGQVGHDAKIKTLTEQVQDLTRDVASIRNQSSALQILRKELDARDKKVEELTLQLDALRRIDQELKEKSSPTRPSETIIPAKDERASTP